MSQNPRQIDRKRGKKRRDRSRLRVSIPMVPNAEPLEVRRLLTTVINEFGGSATLTNPAGVALGPDGNVWFTESNASTPGIGLITPSGAIETFSSGLSTNSIPKGIASGPDNTLWFTDPGANKIGEITTSGTITEFTLPVAGSEPDQIALGSDNNLWFTEPGINAIGMINTSGAVTNHSIPTANSSPTGITAGPQGSLWFTEEAVGKIGQIGTNGAITEFATGITTGSDPTGITEGPDGNLWFTENAADQIGQITQYGTVTEFRAGSNGNSGPLGITTGPDGSLWFTEQNDNTLGQITTSGTVTEFSGPGASTASLDGITSGSDGNLWFTENVGNHVDRITTDGVGTQFPSPTNALSSGAFPISIANGPNGDLYFTEQDTDKIGRIDTSGNINEFSAGIPIGALPTGITLGPVPTGGGSANLWFTELGTTNAGAIGEITATGTLVGQFPTPTSDSNPEGITLGPNGDLWFTENGDGSADGTAGIGMITPTGTITEFRNGLTSGYFPNQIVEGPDGNLWFTADSTNGGLIGKISPPSVTNPNPIITEYNITNSANGFISDPVGIVAGTNNDLWFTDAGNSAIGRITTSGTITEYSTGLSSTDMPASITLGPDGNFWFTDPRFGETPSLDLVTFSLTPNIGRITPQGVITLFPTPSGDSYPQGITTGPDDNLWFTEATANQIGQVVLTNSIATSTAVPTTVPATVTSNFTLATFVDRSDATNASNFLASIDYGDGTTGVGTVLPVNGHPGEFKVFTSHKYNTTGTFPATVTIDNATGTLSPLSTPVQVTSPISLTGEPINGIVGTRSNTLVATFTDADMTATSGAFSATINFGDGSSTSTGLVLPIAGVANAYNIFDGHVYSTNGTFNGTITLTDLRNNLTASANFTVTIAPATVPTVFNEVGPSTLTPGSQPNQITLGPNSALWFTEANTDSIGRITTGGVVTQYSPPSTVVVPLAGQTSTTGYDGITSGSDGNLWFTDPGGNEIGQITPSGVFAFFANGLTSGSDPTGIINGPDGALWFTEQQANAIGRITTAGVITQYSINQAGYDPDAITSGSDGNLWFVAVNSNLIGRITPQGTITYYPGATGTEITSITSGPDGDLWFTEPAINMIGKINPTTFAVTEYNGSGIASPTSIVTGPDGLLYFTSSISSNASEIGRITTSGVATGFNGGLTLNSNAQGIATGPDQNVYFTESSGDRIGQMVLPQTSISSASFANILTNAGQTINQQVGFFFENSTIPTLANFQSTINWGDGTALVPGTLTFKSPNEYIVSGAHTYTTPGVYQGTAEILNAAGEKSVNFTVTVSAVIAVTGVNVDAQADRSFSQEVATFTDNSGTSATNSYLETIEWGDGTSTATTVTGFTGKVLGTHTYASTGQYTIKTTVQVVGQPDDTGSGTSTATISPFVSVLTATGNDLYQTIGSASPEILAEFEDSSNPMALNPPSLYAAQINWGDGTSTTGQIVSSTPGVYEVVGSHAYKSAGQFQAKVLITKADAPDTASVTDPVVVSVAGPIQEFNNKYGLQSTPSHITSGPDHTLYFTEPSANAIGFLTTTASTPHITTITAGITPESNPTGIVTGPDGNLWFTQTDSNQIGRFNPMTGVVTEFTLSAYSINYQPTEITEGPDGNLWFTTAFGPNQTGAIGRITPSGVVTLFQQGLRANVTPMAITLGPDNNLWFTEVNTDGGGAFIGRITPQGVITNFNVVTNSQALSSIVAGPDGALWFTEDSPGAIGRITTAGVVTQSGNGLSPNSEPNGITDGPDGNLWFVDTGTNQVERLTTGDVITPFAVPTSNSQPLDIVTGPDDNLWFTETAVNQIGQVILPQSVYSTVNPLTATAGQSSSVPLALYADNAPFVFLPKYFTGNINFGDGTSTSADLATDVTTGPVELPYTLTANHTYVDPGTYTGNSTIQDAIGATNPADFTVVVSPSTTPIPPRTFVVTNTNDSGAGSLRQAILNANQVGGHTITFAIPGQGVQTISPLSPLPAIEDTSIIDGTTEATFQGSSATSPLVQIDGVEAGQDQPGLVFAGNAIDSTLLDLSLFDFIGPQVVVDATHVSVYGNYLGMSSDGKETSLSTSTTLPAQLGVDGLVIEEGEATVGGTSAGQGNLISGNLAQGIEIDGAAASGTFVIGNDIGTDPSGLKALPNRIDGITANSGADSLIIGRNVISGNDDIGIDLYDSSGDFVFENLIGLDATGEHPLGNANAGISLDETSTNNTIGLGALTGPIATINGGSGLWSGTNGPSIGLGGVVFPISSNRLDNFVGVTAAGASVSDGGFSLPETSSLSSVSIGTYANPTVTGSNGVLVSGFVDLTGDTIGLGSSNSISFGSLGLNDISGNGAVGLTIQGGSAQNSILNNRIGTDATGSFSLGNGIAGILISDAYENFVGQRNQVSGNGSVSQGAGIWIEGPTSFGNVVQGNLVGTDASGAHAIGNKIIGVLINDAPFNVIGGNLPAEANEISGNTVIGVMVAGQGSIANLVAGNLIGTDDTGRNALPNGTGVYIDNAPGNYIGGSLPDFGNVISGNSSDGVQIFGPAASGNLFQLNKIGTDDTGTMALGNAGSGLLVNGAPGTRIVDNLLDSNREDGIFISGAGSTKTLIEGNTIGRGLGGQRLGNALFGLLVGNGAPNPTQVANVNVNNALGAVRNTNLAPPTTTNSTTGTKASSKKVSVKVKAESFGDRSLTTLQSRGQLKSKPKAKV